MILHILSKFGSSKVKILQSQNFQPFFGFVTVMVRMHFFYAFFNMFFQKSQKWTFLKCPKNDFRNTFVYLFLTFWVPYCKYKILSVLFVSLEYTIVTRKYNKSVLFMVSIFCCYFANTLPILCQYFLFFH